MLHPIFTVVLRNPELIVNHLAGYAELVKVEASVAGKSVLTRLISGIVSVVSALLALILVGVATMLGVLHGSFNWILIIVPGTAVVLAIVSALIAKRPSQNNAFYDLKEQFHADLEAFNSVKERNHEH